MVFLSDTVPNGSKEKKFLEPLKPICIKASQGMVPKVPKFQEKNNKIYIFIFFSFFDGCFYFSYVLYKYYFLKNVEPWNLGTGQAKNLDVPRV